MSESTTLISTDAPKGLLSFPQVVTEAGCAALTELTVTSHSDLPLVVHLESSAAAGAVTFQLENENLRHAADDEDDPDDEVPRAACLASARARNH